MERDENKIAWGISVVRESVPSAYNRYRHPHIPIQQLFIKRE